MTTYIYSFLSLIILISIILGIVAFSNSLKTNVKLTIAVRILAIISLSFSLLSIINMIITLSTATLYVYNGDIYSYMSNWIYATIPTVCIAITLSLITLILSFYAIKTAYDDNKTINKNIVEEIKELKGLVDCGALTQEEFDLLKAKKIK